MLVHAVSENLPSTDPLSKPLKLVALANAGKLLNLSIATKTFSSKWKLSRVIPIQGVSKKKFTVGKYLRNE